MIPRALRDGLEEWLRTPFRRLWLDRRLEELAPRMRGRVLEIGTGRSRRLGSFRPPTEGVVTWVFADIVVTDRPDICASIEQLCFPTGTFDTVVCLEVLEYVTHVATGLREVLRVLKDGGTLIVSTPFMHHVDHPHDYWRWTSNGLRHVLQDAGFDVFSLDSAGSAFALVAHILKKSIFRMRYGKFRTLLALLARPFIMRLFRLDEWFACRVPELRRFTGGYLAIAVRPTQKRA